MKQKLKLNKQYGIINKQVITNKSLSVGAKGLYVYMCGRSGNKGYCMPLVATICNDLGINEVTFHKYKNELIKAGVICVAKQGEGLHRRNKYVLVGKQDKGNYGIVPLNVVTNNKISLKAKAIYGLISCIAGGRFIAYPLAKVIYLTLGVCRGTYFSCMQNLKEYGCVLTKQLHINGRFAHCNYYINGKEPNKPKTRYIIKVTKKQNKITSKTNKTITNINYNLTENYIAENIEYEALKGLYGNNSKALYILEQMYSVLVNDTYADNIKSVNYKGQVFSSSIVKAVFKKLNYNNIKYVIDKMLKLDSKINNIRSYVRVAMLSSYYEVK